MKLFAAFDKGHNKKSLAGLCMKLLSEQKRTWYDLEEGCKSLKDVKIREIVCHGFSVRVQHNPGRIRSTLANVGTRSVNERPCFLCLNNLPEDQKGILYQNKYLILCNPMPVFSGHFTISHLIHQPQAIAEHVDIFLQLMGDFGSRWSVLYNGPRCGASAPDHLHFQAIPSGVLPLEKEIMDENRLVRDTWIEGIQVSRARGLGREVVILEADEPMRMASAFKRTMTALKGIGGTNREPMVNVAGFHQGKKWRLAVFPRAKHRPDAFFRKGSAQVAVSPAVIEMGGVLVTPMENDFQRLDASAVEGIFREVSLESGVVKELLHGMAGLY